MTGPADNGSPQLSDQVLVALRRIIRATDLHSRSLLRKFGLTSPQLIVLREVAARGELSGSSLARAIAVSLPTLTGIVGRLEARGLVARRRSETDKRQMLVSITPAGRQLLEDAPSPLQERFTLELAALEQWEQTQILSVLQRIVAMMEAGELDASPILTTGVLEEHGPVATAAEGGGGSEAEEPQSQTGRTAEPTAEGETTCAES